jgi:hypothetical protein
LEVGKTFQFSIKSLDTESRRITLGL